MISDITLGQYFPGKSRVHSLDPRTKLILTVLYITGVFVSNNPLGFAVLTAVTVGLVFMSGISFKILWKSVKPLMVILLVTAAINIFMTDGSGKPLLDLGFAQIYTEGIVKAFFMAYRVVMVIIGTSVLLTYTTTPISLTDGIESLLSPLKKVGVPVHAFAMMMSIALRFIPTLVEETEKIMNAQKSRGADFSNGTLVQRAKALIPILIPLFASSFKRAEELATAMECRCYRGDSNRTKLVKLELKSMDYLWLALSALIFASIILLAILPYNYIVDSVIYNVIFYRII